MNGRSFVTQLQQIEATRSVFERRETMDPSFRARGHEFRSDRLLRLRLGWRQRNEEIVWRCRRARGTTLVESIYKTEKSSPGVVQKQSCDVGFTVKPVLIIDAKATQHIDHRHGIGKIKHVDVAHLWLQDDVESNRLRVRRIMSEDNLAEIGTEALSNRISESMRYPWDMLMLKRT